MNKAISKRSDTGDRIYGFVCHFTRSHYGAFPTARDIAGALDVSTSVVAHWLTRLHAAGLIGHVPDSERYSTRRWFVVGSRYTLGPQATTAARRWVEGR